MSSLTYTPPPSVAEFLVDPAFISLIVGPVGSTKTTAGIMKIAYHAKQMARSRNGRRVSRAVWVRNTREQLRDTSIPDFLKWYPDGVAGSYLKTDYKFTLRFDDVECEVLFRGLDDANDVKRLLSLQASFAIFDEFREIHSDIFETMQGRLGRYPDSMLVPHRKQWGVDAKGNPIAGCVTDEGKPNAHLWGMTNPPDMDTYWERTLSDPPPNMKVYIQPGGLDPKADWLQYLPQDYYGNLMEGKSQEWIDVYINAKFGATLSGKAVFPTFKPDFHVSKEPLKPIASSAYPLIIGMDFGLSPAITVSQRDPRGRLLTYAAVAAFGMGVTRFIDEKLKPLLANKFIGMPVVIVGDPAGTVRSQTDEKTCFDILKVAGYRAIPASTNNPIARIAAVDTFLNRQIDGGPGMLIDPSCKPLIDALRGGYRYKIKKSGDVEDSPEKNSHSHVADAHQYACLHADGGATFGWNSKPIRRQIVRVDNAGWT